ncbi:hypothetical protein F441_13595 [Phytophthora nicotianae CJ01A1]|uniref:Uncharacterized protein n=3 Tax=Phytophthora nicotianae TaxID=4792 RepID=W2YUX0_PHYNI|nr:hypothetical protein L915_13336 [Phytophthora nicotianae]ETL34584.1 hypothetical protein L916_13218 [Phytophthora nicotianae]ETL87799.1 hypothetical protein L917_13043 [Phytophthora nicotianae]ETP10811.1 hypothetical protein F441_13595 [Phytophthora nicotianae CJ01A1]ETP38952.1 hypothetical protein F442_13529 [Phytophthora nicotianae P10297]
MASSIQMAIREDYGVQCASAVSTPMNSARRAARAMGSEVLLAEEAAGNEPRASQLRLAATMLPGCPHLGAVRPRDVPHELLEFDNNVASWRRPHLIPRRHLLDRVQRRELVKR